MGSSVAPKSFPRPGNFGQGGQGIVSQVQDAAVNPYQQIAAIDSNAGNAQPPAPPSTLAMFGGRFVPGDFRRGGGGRGFGGMLE